MGTDSLNVFYYIYQLRALFMAASLCGTLAIVWLFYIKRKENTRLKLTFIFVNAVLMFINCLEHSLYCQSIAMGFAAVMGFNYGLVNAALRITILITGVSVLIFMFLWGAICIKKGLVSRLGGILRLTAYIPVVMLAVYLISVWIFLSSELVRPIRLSFFNTGLALLAFTLLNIYLARMDERNLIASNDVQA